MSDSYFSVIVFDSCHLHNFCLRKRLAKNAKENQTTTESYEQFVARVKDTLMSLPVDLIDHTNESLPTRMNMVIKCYGRRIKY